MESFFPYNLYLLSENDYIIVIGKTTNTQIHQKAKQIIYDGKLVDKTPRGTKEKPLLAELKVNGEVISNGEDIIYVFTDRTYKNRNYSL